MRNRYARKCYRCGLKVEPGAGHFEKVGAKTIDRLGEGVRGHKWITQHAKCAIENRGNEIVHGGKKTLADDFKDIS